jgi:hypothetical protein
MPSGPSKAAETIVALLLPPACREEVLGDLHERYRSRLQYAADALSTVPLVILSRIRRTADPRVLLIQAFALYASFLTAAWFKDAGLLQAQWGLLRLAVPPGMALLGLIVEDAYATPGHRPPLKLLRGPLLGFGLAVGSQAVLRAGRSDLALPSWTMVYGSAMSLLLSSGVRLLFPPVTDRLQGVNAPALWLKQDGRTGEDSQGILQAVLIAAIAAGAIICASIAGISLPTIRTTVAAVFFVLVARHIRKRL